MSGINLALAVQVDFKFFINQALKKTITDASLSSGVAGLYALDSNADVNVFHFDDVFLEQNKTNGAQHWMVRRPG